jgi:acetyl-CoA carboxylase carboxyltransferase component
MADTTDPRLKKLRDLRAQSQLGGGEEKIKAHRAKGRLTARDRLDLLLDPGSFREIDAFVTNRPSGIGMAKQHLLTDGVVTGWGTIEGRLVYVFSQDFTVMGGSLGSAHAAKITKVQDMAMKNGAPIIGINDSGGARIQEGLMSLVGYSDIFLRNTLSSGVVPQISAIMGPCAGGAVYSPALTDFIFMVKNTSHMFLTGPDVVKTVTHEDVTFEQLGGATVHNSTSGVAHFAADSEGDCLYLIRMLMSYLPSNNMEEPPASKSKDDPLRTDDSLDSIVPDNPNKPYDMKEVIEKIVDDGQFFEIQEHYATNIIIGFARLGGQSVGIVANQPAVLAGVLDINASEKAGRFVRFCDCFNIPIITFEDVPGFLPGVSQEHGGIIRSGAKLLYAYCEATVPKICVVTRKAYGGAYCVLSPRATRGDLVLAWPSAELAVMGADGAVNLIYRRDISGASDPAAKKAELVRNYQDEVTNPYVAAQRGFVDDIIEPHDTRPRLINALQMLKNKRDTNPPKKHGNIPM